MRRHELTDEQYVLLEPYLPKPSRAGGHPWAEHRRILNGLFWKLHTGAQWRDIPERYGPQRGSCLHPISGGFSHETGSF